MNKQFSMTLFLYYYNLGYVDEQIGHKLSYTKDGVCKVRKKLGLPKHNYWKHKVRVNYMQDIWNLRMLDNSVVEIAKKLGLCRQTVYSYLNRMKNAMSRGSLI